ncbi:MAG: GNAT family N-acetyltransferase [Candidatus Fermentibacteraceae bacterium]|nr:GNAT family N-acetyltransferase [Candidatus Fermentibacteraceae bacterium]MBN2608868.1 GNAT family N-acetyltransferase [Candidatus Fermentibacteraceae bacterium]
MIQLRRIEGGDRNNWTDFVQRSNNGTIFHLPDFLDYHPEGRFQNHHLLAEDGSGMVSVIPGALSDREDGTWFRSYPGASYGGPVLTDVMGLRKTEKLVDELIAYCRGNGWKGIEMTPPPIVYYRRPHNYLEFSLVRRGFRYRRRELTAVIDLSRFGEELRLGFRSSALRGVRKAQKSGVTVEENWDFDRFYPVLESNLQERHDVRPTHTLEELERLRQLLGNDRIKQFIAVRGGEVLAGMVMFHCNPRVTLAFYISHDQEHQALRPVNLVYMEVIRWAKQMGYHYIDLGTFTLDMEVNYGLCRFKESFSARGIFRNTLFGTV